MAKKIKSTKSKADSRDASSGRSISIKKARKKGKDRGGGDDDLKKMRDKYKKSKDKEEGKGKKNDSLDELKEGKNRRRILPREGTREFYLEVPMHFNVGPNGQSVRCLGKVGAGLTDEGYPLPGTKCPLCKAFLKERARINEKYGKGSEEGKKEYLKAKDKYAPKVRYYMNVLRDDGEVKTLACGDMIMSQLLEYYFEEDSDIGDFTDPENGRWMIIKKIKTGKSDRDVKYKVDAGKEPEEIDLEELSEKMHDLDAVAGQILSPDDVKAIMDGGLDDDSDDASSDDDDDDESADDESDDSDDDDDDADDDDDEDDEDDESSEEEDEDEDEEEDEEEEDDEDDDDDDEDEKPSKKSKSSSKSKVKDKKSKKKSKK